MRNHTGDASPHAYLDQRPVVPREFRAAKRGPPIILALLRADRSAGELEVRQLDLLAFHDPLARLDVVARDLMPEAAGTGVDHDADGPNRADPKGLRRPGVVHPIDLLNLHEMVSRPQAPDLVLPPCDGPVPDAGESGAGQVALGP